MKRAKIFFGKSKFRDGGIIDNSKQEHSDRTSFVRSWFNSEGAKNRFEQTQAQYKGQYDWHLNNKELGINSDIDRLTFNNNPNRNDARSDRRRGVLGYIQDHSIVNYGKNEYERSLVDTHEVTHGVYMHLRGKTEDYLNSITPKRKESRPYVTTPDEIYPHLMEIRQKWGINPNEEVDENRFKSLFKKNRFRNSLFRYYHKEDIQKMLNDLASNKNNNNYI